MAAVAVSSSAVLLGSGLIQNLGPDVLYVDSGKGVSDATGVSVAPGGAIVVSGSVWGVSDGSSDVRTLWSASGLSGASVPE